MKQTILFLAIGGFTATSCNSQNMAQEKVPAVVVNTLQTQFPNATGIDWEKKGGLYEADFDVAGSEDITVQIDASGKMLMQKQEVTGATLPAGIQTAVQAEYKDFTIDEVEKVEKEGATYYQLELDGKGLKSIKGKKLVLTAEGQTAANVAFWD